MNKDLAASVRALDLWVLLDREALNANTLARAIAATFIRRGMPVPAVLPIGLTDEFATDSSRLAMWHAFLKKNEITITPLSDVVATFSMNPTIRI